MNNNISVDLSKMPSEKCSCGWMFFRTRIVLKKIPRFLAASETDVEAQIAFLCCEKCGKPHMVDDKTMAIIKDTIDKCKKEEKTDADPNPPPTSDSSS